MRSLGRLFLAVSSLFWLTCNLSAQNIVGCGKQLSAGPTGSIYRGIPARSNGDDQWGFNSCGQSTQSWVKCTLGEDDSSNACSYGLHWQCVEYVKRFYSLRSDVLQRVDTSGWDYDAVGFLTTNSGGGVSTPLKGFTAFPNDGSSLPMADDIIVFKYGSEGHVAIVVGLNGSTSVDIIEENFSVTGLATLTISPVTNKIEDRIGAHGAHFVIVGWLRPSSSVSATGPTAHFTMSAPGYATVSDPGTLTTSATSGGSVNVTFTSTSLPGSASITNYVWKSNGTTICTSASCSYSFGTPSNTITLTVTDANNKTATATGTVIVNVQTVIGPTAHFTMSAPGYATVGDPNTLTTSVPAGGSITVTFTSTSVPGSAAIKSYVWMSNGTQLCVGAGASCTAPFSSPSNTITLTVTDANGKTSSSPAQALLVVNQQAPAPTITTTSLNPAIAIVNQSYSAQAIMASGGTLPYSWSASNAPTGLGMSPGTGVLSGTPTVSGSFNVTVNLHDNSSPQKTASQSFPLTVNPTTSSLAITTAALSPSTATVGTAYTSQAIMATGGTSPYTWSVSGAPNGVTMNAATGVLSGTPSASGTFNVTVNVHDSSSPQQSISKGFAFTVNIQSLSIASATLSPSTGTAGTYYSAAAMSASGGTSPYTWSVSGAPSGFTMNPSSGVLSGTPASSGTYSFNVGVADSSSPQQTASKLFTLTVNSSSVTGPTAHFTMSAPGYATVSDPGTLTTSVPTGGSITATFTSTSVPGSAAITSYAWYNNNSSFCSGTPCAVPFGTPSNSIKLTVTDANGKSSSATALLIVNIASSQPPTATTGSASAITNSGATIGATVNANGTDTHIYFLYAANSGLSGATQTPSQDIGSGTTGVSVSANIAGLSAGTAYYFRVVATNGSGTVSGSVANFTTSMPAPNITSVTPSIPGSTTILEPLTITGTNLPTAASGGYLQFTDTVGNTYLSTAHPERIQSSSSTQWVYTIDDNNDAGTWHVQILTAAGVPSNKVSFTVQ